MNATEVEMMVRSVIIQLGLPFTLLSVVGSPTGWNIRVGTSTKGIVRLTISGGPSVMRAALQEKLEAEL
ncbi:MAG TPA: hypothetical protein VGJ29_17820 [Vicinamibacterales bacterium]|jgi:hypothetical protein